MIQNINMEVSINPKNIKKYSEITGREIKKEEKVIIINQNDLLKSSRMEVKCTCDICNKTFKKKRVDIKKEITLCSKECRNEFLKKGNEEKKIRKEVECTLCNNNFFLRPSEINENNNFCSRECYSNYRKKEYKKEKIYNYQDIKVKCTCCDNIFKTYKWKIGNNKNLFCSKKCYYKHRKDNYNELYYNRKMNDSRKETTIERKVRKSLERLGIQFEQEFGFARKYFIDFYLYNQNIMIEVYGDYWHVNPEKYDIYKKDKTKKKMNNYQEKAIQKDLSKENFIKSKGYNLLILWESDIKNEEEDIDNKILSFLESATTTCNAPLFVK